MLSLTMTNNIKYTAQIDYVVFLLSKTIRSTLVVSRSTISTLNPLTGVCQWCNAHIRYSRSTQGRLYGFFVTSKSYLLHFTLSVRYPLSFKTFYSRSIRIHRSLPSVPLKHFCAYTYTVINNYENLYAQTCKCVNVY